MASPRSRSCMTTGPASCLRSRSTRVPGCSSRAGGPVGASPAGVPAGPPDADAARWRRGARGGLDRYSGGSALLFLPQEGSVVERGCDRLARYLASMLLKLYQHPRTVGVIRSRSLEFEVVLARGRGVQVTSTTGSRGTLVRVQGENPCPPGGPAVEMFRRSVSNREQRAGCPSPTAAGSASER